MIRMLQKMLKKMKVTMIISPESNKGLVCNMAVDWSLRNNWKGKYQIFKFLLHSQLCVRGSESQEHLTVEEMRPNQFIDCQKILGHFWDFKIKILKISNF